MAAVACLQVEEQAAVARSCCLRASSLEEEALGPEVLELWARTSEEHPQTVDGDDRPLK